MTGCRSNGVLGLVRTVALSAAVMVAVPPLAAQEEPPLDIIPIPSAEVDEIGPAPDAAVPAIGEPGAEFEVLEVMAPDPEAAGRIEEADGGFPFDMWAGVDRRLVERLLPRLPTGMTSRAVNDLTRRLLLSAAAPPEGPAEANLLALRIERLAAMGEGVEVNHLMRAAPPDLDDAILAQTRLDALLLTGDFVGACAQARELIRMDDLPYWEKVLIFCQALNDRHAAAALGIELLRERGVPDDPALEVLLAALAGSAYGEFDSLPQPTALHLAMLRVARLAVPEDAIRNAAPVIARAIALTATVPLDLRLRAAERAEALGSLPTETLAELYASVPFTPEELSNPWPRIKTDRGALARALLYQTISIQVVPAARAEVLRAAWLLGAESGGWDGFSTAARVSLDDLLGLRPLPELVWIAGDAARALLAAGRSDAVGPWLDLAKAQARANADAAQVVAKLAPIIDFAAADSAEPWDDARFAAWREMQAGKPEPYRRRGEKLLLGLLLAFERELPAEALLAQIGEPAAVWLRAPPQLLMRRLDMAAAEGRIGETVMLALIALAVPDTGLQDPMTLGAAVAALNRIGLEAEARAIAVEALLSREF